MTFLAVCGIVFLVGFISCAGFFLGREFGYSGIPDPVDIFACIAQAVACCILICSPILLFCAMLVFGGVQI